MKKRDPRCKFDIKTEREIVRRYLKGESSLVLSKAYGVNDQAIRNIVRAYNEKVRSKSETSQNYYSKKRIKMEGINFDKKLAFVTECVRAEGTINRSSVSFNNTSVDLLKFFKKALDSSNIQYDLSRYFQIQLEIPLNIKSQHIKVMDEERKFNFYVAKIFPHVKAIRVIIFYDKEINKEKVYSIKIKEKILKLKVSIPESGHILTEYTGGFSSCIIRLRILGRYGKILRFLLSHRKRLFNFLKNSSNDVFLFILSAFIACDGGLSNCKNKLREIYLDSKDKAYLTFIRSEMEKRFKIQFHLYKCRKKYYRLMLSNKQNIFNFLKRVILLLPEHKRKAEEILNSYERIMSEEEILPLIKKLGSPTAYELASVLGKSYRQIKRHIRRLSKKNKIITINNGKRYRYKATERGN